MALINAFTGVDPGYLLNALDSFTLPNVGIQPGIVPVDRPTWLHGNIARTNARGVTPPGIDADGNVITSSVCIINPDLDSETKDSYSETDAIGDIPIYFFVLTNFGHASIMVYTNGKLYSIGMGLRLGSVAAVSLRQADLVAPAMIYSPDALIKPQEGKALPNGSTKLFKYRIIDMGLFKRKHLDRLKQVVGTVPRQVITQYSQVSPKRFRFESYLIDIGTTYSYFSPRSIVKSTGSGFNCVSFAESIFNERVNCGNKSLNEIADPSACASRNVSDVPALFRAYIQRYIDASKSPPAAPNNLSGLFPQLNAEAAVDRTWLGFAGNVAMGTAGAVGKVGYGAGKLAYNCVGALCPTRGTMKNMKGGRRKNRKTRRRRSKNRR